MAYQTQPTQAMICSLIILSLNYVTTQGIILDVPYAFSISFCHITPFIGGSCSGSSIPQPSCNSDTCEDGAINEEIIKKYTEFVTGYQKRVYENHDEYSYLPFEDTMSIYGGKFVTIPKDIFAMTELTSITIKDCKLRKINFSDFFILPKLKNIDLSNNTIKTIEINDGSNRNSAVKNMDVSFNFIETVPNYVMKRFSQLDHLNMSHNMINSIGAKAFEGLVNLKTLDLSYNKLTEIENIINQLPRSTFSDSNEAQSENLQKISKLYLDNNLINHINFQEVFDKKLSELSIGQNQIPCDELSFAKYSNLGAKFNRIVTAKNLHENGKEVNGISCQSILVWEDQNQNSNAVILIKYLQNEMDYINKRLDNLADGIMVLFNGLHEELIDLKKKVNR